MNNKKHAFRSTGSRSRDIEGEILLRTYDLSSVSVKSLERLLITNTMSDEDKSLSSMCNALEHERKISFARPRSIQFDFYEFVFTVLNVVDKSSINSSIVKIHKILNPCDLYLSRSVVETSDIDCSVYKKYVGNLSVSPIALGDRYFKWFS